MKITKIGTPRVIMSGEGAPHGYFGWPTAARIKDGRIAVGASGFRVAHVCPFGKSVISFSDDDGETYSKPVPVIDTVLDDRDAGLCPFGESGLIFTSFNNTVEFQRQYQIRKKRVNAEIDAYLDTVDPEAEKLALGSDFRVSFDNGRTWGEIFKSPVTSPHGPVELKDGRILWVGRPFNVNGFEDKDRPFTRVCEMTPDGKITEIGHVDDLYTDDGQPINFCEPYLFECPSGKLLCHLRAEPQFTTFQSESYNGGRTWTKPRLLLPLDHGGAPSHVMLHSSGILIASIGYRKGPYGIILLFSRDEGVTWEDGGFLVDDSPNGDVGYPSTVELADGSLMTVYYGHAEESGPALIYQQNWALEV